MSAVVATAAIFFDLDGTLIDSAPDLACTANQMRVARDLPPLPYEQLRCMVGSGARGMIGAALGIKPDAPEFEALKHEFLDAYERRMLQETRIFDAVHGLLDALHAHPLPWGIVTNKAERFALPITQSLGLAARAVAVIGGDTTPYAKPHPAPLLEAARRAGVAAQHCIYVGDDERDIIAGRAAGMRTVAAAWGYLGEGKAVHDWGADLTIDQPHQLLNWLSVA